MTDPSLVPLCADCASVLPDTRITWTYAPAICSRCRGGYTTIRAAASAMRWCADCLGRGQHEDVCLSRIRTFGCCVHPSTELTLSPYHPEAECPRCREELS